MVSQYSNDIKREFDKRFSLVSDKGLGVYMTCSEIARRLPLHQVTQLETRIVAKILRDLGVPSHRSAKGMVYYVYFS